MFNHVTDVEIRWAGIFSVARGGWLTPKRAALEADLWDWTQCSWLLCLDVILVFNSNPVETFSSQTREQRDGDFSWYPRRYNLSGAWDLQHRNYGYSAALLTKCFAKLAFKPKMKTNVVAKDVHRLASH